jgi:7,8-dihydropterin-6-yl-methyl-4-(beta-D-ribofuranosyl)aminobenzene 5'-phosphate synthase
MNQIALQPVESAAVTTIIDNVSDALLRDEGVAKRSGPRLRVETPFARQSESVDPLRAEHGFSALVTVTTSSAEHHLLFDAGLSTTGVAENAARLELSLQDIQAIVLSHGHHDHTMGMHGIASELGRRNLPVFIHPDAWRRRRVVIEGREPVELPTPSRSAYEGAGFEVIEERRASFLLEDSVLITGEVDRTTDFERGMQTQQAMLDGTWVPDPLIMDDQALLMHLRGKGLVVLTGCGHAGIVNIVRHACRVTGVNEVYAVIGGFHLQGPGFESTFPATLEGLKAVNPRVIVPAHCTGWRAVHRLAAAFPEAFVQNSVGTRLEL